VTAAASGSGYLAPDVGFDAMRDAVALIRCTAAEDHEGMGAIANGNAHPRCLAAAVAAIATMICRRGSLDNAAIDALLSEIASQAGDWLLDQQSPEKAVISHR
jgi:hypothetical protein